MKELDHAIEVLKDTARKNGILFLSAEDRLKKNILAMPLTEQIALKEKFYNCRGSK